jgi:hypothetical protein
MIMELKCIVWLMKRQLTPMYDVEWGVMFLRDLGNDSMMCLCVYGGSSGDGR